MKKIFLPVFLLFLFTSLCAQWSDKTNYFTDSMHMPVCTAAQIQKHPITIRSYPDGGYIVFWEDSRNSATTKQDIYAQKYDRNGKKLWKKDGVPVVKGPNDQRVYSSTNADYRNYSYAATDSTGGFYISYIDDSINTYDWQRICVQHVLSDGSAVFGGAGFIVAESKDNGYTYASQQLVADGNGGFYIGFIRNSSNVDVFVYCYKDVGGKMKYYGGGQMDINAYEEQIGQCSNFDIAYRDAYANDYFIYPDLQKGCNVAMTLSQNAGGNDRYFTGFNRLVRVKKNSKTKTSNNIPVTYKKDSVLTFYTVHFHTYIFQCGNEVGTGYVLESNGFLQTSNLTYQAEYSKGVVVPTNGNINADIFSFVERKYINSSVTDWFTHVLYRSSEKYDSIPYEYTVYPYQPETYFNSPKPGLNKINFGDDTLLYNGSVYDYDYALGAGGNKIYASAIMYDSAFTHRDILLQQLRLLKISSDSFAVQLNTVSKRGIKIGKEVNTGFGGTSMSFDNPQLMVDSNGNAVFYIREYGTSARVSPIINGTQLTWGALGRRIGSGAYAGSYYYPDNPYVSIDPLNGSGIISWQDARTYNGVYTDVNIFTRHLDSLNKSSYQPVYKPVQKLPYSGGQAYPLVLYGSSKQYSLVEFLDFPASVTSPVADILDNYNLGAVGVNVFENNSAIRSYNGKPYLDRNYTFKPEINPSLSSKISLHLFFTKAQFNALKAAKSSVHDPSDLAVIMQPYTTNNAPSVYTPVTGEIKIDVQSWKAVTGGYYIAFDVKKFKDYTNYYIFPASVTLPLKQADVQFADAANETAIFIYKLYPNPVTGNIVNLQTGNMHIATMLVEIYSADGKLCYHHNLSYQPQNIQLTNLANGVYTMRITAGKLIYTSAFIKTNRPKEN